ncbi:hypothetical protein [Glaciibacter superstes]|uniref:hypothetical protein n=1 Tax=Glaciibacter superstes TaxID=501023 RepID=UPI0003B52B32|nr:hypothetical protein [Glaciibacter superstes]
MSMAIEYQIRKSTSATQPYYWRIVETGNSSVLATSETYVQKQSAVSAAYLAKNGSASGDIMDYTGS